MWNTRSCVEQSAKTNYDLHFSLKSDINLQIQRGYCFRRLILGRINSDNI